MNSRIDHFTVVGLVAWPLNGSEAGVDLGLIIVNRGNGYETRQRSLLYVIVLFLGLDPAQSTIVVYSELRN